MDDRNLDKKFTNKGYSPRKTFTSNFYSNNKMSELIEKEKDFEFNQKLLESNFNINDAYIAIMSSDLNEDSDIESDLKNKSNRNTTNKKKNKNKPKINEKNKFSVESQADLINLGITPGKLVLNNKNSLYKKETFNNKIASEIQDRDSVNLQLRNSIEYSAEKNKNLNIKNEKELNDKNSINFNEEKDVINMNNCNYNKNFKDEKINLRKTINNVSLNNKNVFLSNYGEKDKIKFKTFKESESYNSQKLVFRTTNSSIDKKYNSIKIFGNNLNSDLKLLKEKESRNGNPKSNGSENAVSKFNNKELNNQSSFIGVRTNYNKFILNNKTDQNSNLLKNTFKDISSYNSKNKQTLDEYSTIKITECSVNPFWSSPLIHKKLTENEIALKYNRDLRIQKKYETLKENFLSNRIKLQEDNSSSEEEMKIKYKDYQGKKKLKKDPKKFTISCDSKDKIKKNPESAIQKDSIHKKDSIISNHTSTFNKLTTFNKTMKPSKTNKMNITEYDINQNSNVNIKASQNKEKEEKSQFNFTSNMFFKKNSTIKNIGYNSNNINQPDITANNNSKIKIIENLYEKVTDDKKQNRYENLKHSKKKSDFNSTINQSLENIKTSPFRHNFEKQNSSIIRLVKTDKERSKYEQVENEVKIKNIRTIQNINHEGNENFYSKNNNFCHNVNQIENNNITNVKIHNKEYLISTISESPRTNRGFGKKVKNEPDSIKNNVFDIYKDKEEIVKSKSNLNKFNTIGSENIELDSNYFNIDIASKHRCESIRDKLITPFSQRSSVASTILINKISNIECRTNKIKRTFKENIQGYKKIEELDKEKAPPLEHKVLRVSKKPKTARTNVVMIPSSVEEKRKNFVNLSENRRNLLKMADFIENMNDKLVLKLKDEIEVQYYKHAMKNGLVELDDILEKKYEKVVKHNGILESMTLKTRRLENSIFNTRTKIEEKHFTKNERDAMNKKNNVKIKRKIVI